MGNRPSLCLAMFVCVRISMWFVFRFPTVTSLPFLSLAELVVALLAGSGILGMRQFLGAYKTIGRTL